MTHLLIKELNHFSAGLPLDKQVELKIILRRYDGSEKLDPIQVRVLNLKKQGYRQRDILRELGYTVDTPRATSDEVRLSNLMRGEYSSFVNSTPRKPRSNAKWLDEFIRRMDERFPA